MSRTSTSRRSEQRLERIEILSPECSHEIELEEVASFIGDLFPSVDLEIKPSPMAKLKGKMLDRIARFLAASRVKDADSPFRPSEPMYGEVDYELRGLSGDARLGGVVYDGRRFEEVLIGLLDSGNRLETARVVVTDRLISTYSSDDMRHHLRTILLGFPSIISVPGLVEAPAKPKEYYRLKQRLETTGSAVDPEIIKSAFKGRFLEYGSSDMTEVAKGLLLQAVVHHLALEPFCHSLGCRLFNAHWQEDLIRSQSGSPGLCPKHTRLVKRMGKDPVVSW